MGSNLLQGICWRKWRTVHEPYVQVPNAEHHATEGTLIMNIDATDLIWIKEIWTLFVDYSTF